MPPRNDRMPYELHWAILIMVITLYRRSNILSRERHNHLLYLLAPVVADKNAFPSSYAKASFLSLYCIFFPLIQKKEVLLDLFSKHIRDRKKLVFLQPIEYQTNAKTGSTWSRISSPFFQIRDTCNIDMRPGNRILDKLFQKHAPSHRRSPAAA